VVTAVTDGVDDVDDVGGPVTQRGLDRLVNFGDAVVAIAITLLVLPLIDLHTENESAGISELVHHHGFAFGSFFLSFLVIGRFWQVHHALFESVDAYDTLLIRLHMLWLLTIAFLPFPTAMLGVHSATIGTTGLYIGTLTVSSACLASMRWHIDRTPALRRVELGKSVAEGYLTTALFGLALVLTLTIPGAGSWPLLLLVLDPGLGSLLRLRRLAALRATARTASQERTR
jgi:uncharacterized membrane protein